MARSVGGDRWRRNARPAQRSRAPHRAHRVHGRRQDDARPRARGSARPAVPSTSTRRSRSAPARRSPSSSRSAARRVPRDRGRHAVRAALAAPEPAVIALGGGAVTNAENREALQRRVHVLRDVDVDTRLGARPPLEPAARAGRGGVPRALRGAAAALPRGRRRASRPTSTGVVLAAAGVHHERGALDLLGELVPGDGAVALRRRRARDGHLRAARAGGARRPAHDDARAAVRRGGEGDRRRAAALERAAARPRRHARRARRRLHDRRRRIRRRDLPARRAVGRRCRRRSSARSTRRSAARPRSTSRRARTSSARSTGRRAS